MAAYVFNTVHRVDIVTRFYRTYRAGSPEDFYVLNQKYSADWDRGYINRQLASVELDKFEGKLRDMAYAFFGEEETEVSDEDITIRNWQTGECLISLDFLLDLMGRHTP